MKTIKVNHHASDQLYNFYELLRGMNHIDWIIIGAGYLGSEFARVIQNHGHVTLFGSFNHIRLRNVHGVLSRRISEYDDVTMNIILLEHYLTEARKHDRTVIVVNCLANTSTRDDAAGSRYLQADIQQLVNVEFVKRLHELCIEQSVKLVHMSSADMYRDSREGERFVARNELSPLACDTGYYCSKLLGERMIFPTVMYQSAVPTLVVRPRLLYDSSCHHMNLARRLATFDGALDCPQSVSHLHTVIAATIHLVAKGHRGVYNVCDSGTVTLSNFLKGKKVVPCNYNTKTLEIDCSKLIETGFAPGVAAQQFRPVVDCLS